MFVCSAVLKLISLDSFEIYLYSLGLFDFVITALLARLLIAAEFVIGCFLILKLHYRFAWTATLLVLCAFTIFLVYVMMFREDDNCYCFGDIIKLKPEESILKNIITIFLLIITRKEKSHEYRHKILITSAITILSIAIPFFIMPADALYNMIYSRERKLNNEVFRKTFLENEKKELITIVSTEQDLPDIVIDSTSLYIQGKKMMIFITPGCKFCMTGMKKINIMAENLNINKNDIKIITFGHEKSIAGFIKETGSDSYEYWRITPPEAIDICLGRFPTFVFMKNDSITGVYDYRQIDDKTMTKHLK